MTVVRTHNRPVHSDSEGMLSTTMGRPRLMMSRMGVTSRRSKGRATGSVPPAVRVSRSFVPAVRRAARVLRDCK